MFKDRESKTIIFISILILSIPVMLLVLLYRTILISSGTGALVKSDYVEILNSISTAFIGLAGNFLTVVGAYFIFKKEKDEEKHSEAELKQYHMENITKILVESINNTYNFVEYICQHHAAFSVEIEDLKEYKNMVNGMLLEIHQIALYEKYNTVYDPDQRKNRYISNALDTNPRLYEKDYNYRYEDVSRYFSLRDRDTIREWLNIVNTARFDNLMDLHNYLVCRNDIVSIINKIDDVYKEGIYDFLFEKVKDIYDIYNKYDNYQESY